MKNFIPNDYKNVSNDELIQRIKLLESEVKDYKEWNNYLQTQIKKRPSLEKIGSSGKAWWKLKLNEKSNILTVKIGGCYNYSSAKKVSVIIQGLLTYTRSDFTLILDVTELDLDFEKRALFHLRKIAFYCSIMNIKKAIRIISPEKREMSALFNDILSEMSEDTWFERVEVESIEEAKKVLLANI